MLSRSSGAKPTWLAITFHAGPRAAQPVEEPVVLRAAEDPARRVERARAVAGRRSRSGGSSWPSSWLDRYWRVSSTWNVASEPHGARRNSGMSLPTGLRARGSGECSQ